MIRQARPATETRAGPRYYPTQSILATVLEGDFPIARGIVSDISVCGARLITNVTMSRGLYVKLNLWSRNEQFLEADALVLWSSETIEPALEVAGISQGVFFTHRLTDLRKRMEKLLVPPTFMDMNVARQRPSFACQVSRLAKTTLAIPAIGNEAPFEDEFDLVKRDLVRDFESLFSKLRAD